MIRSSACQPWRADHPGPCRRTRRPSRHLHHSLGHDPVEHRSYASSHKRRCLRTEFCDCTSLLEVRIAILAPIRPMWQQPGNREPARCSREQSQPVPHRAWRGMTIPSPSLFASSEPAPHLQYRDELRCSSWPARSMASEMSVPSGDASASKPVRAQLDRLAAQPQEA